ncbi:MAG: fumarylacetoacetase [Chloroflexota bacterium]|nr:fumarylacetoacetase [Lentimicrobium sp.]
MDVLSKTEVKASWIKPSAESDFSIHNIPFGICRFPDGSVGAASRIDNKVLNLYALQRDGFFEKIKANLEGYFNQPTLNDFIKSGKSVTSKVRKRLQEILEEGTNEITDYEEFTRKYLFNTREVTMHLPVRVTDYTDFYSSIEHATNVGTMFRDASNPLLPNWKHLPVGYHGRASSIVVSGTKIRRPKGQILPAGESKPVFSPTKMLDFELEMAFVVGKNTELGTSVNVNKAEDYIFGFVLFNDLSARDIQSWEYVPLGPFLSKNFGSVVSPWIVTLEALEPFRVEGPVQETEVLDYLKTTGLRNYDINLEVCIKPEKEEPTLVCATNFKYMYWNICQQLAHHTVNGCNITVGDMYASGTISGPVPGSYGSLLELTWRGARPLKVGKGERAFIEDYDSVILRGYARKDGIRVGFGKCETTILPATDA